jgi:hypothetical protein
MKAYIVACEELDAAIGMFDADADSIDVAQSLLVNVGKARDAFKMLVDVRMSEFAALESKAENVIASSMCVEIPVEPPVEPLVEPPVEPPVVPEVAEVPKPVETPAEASVIAEVPKPVEVPVVPEPRVIIDTGIHPYAVPEILTVYIYELPRVLGSTLTYILYNNRYACMHGDNIDIYYDIIERILTDLGDIRNKYLEFRAFESVKLRRALSISATSDIAAKTVISRLTQSCLFWAIEDYSGTIAEIPSLLASYRLCMSEQPEVRIARMIALPASVVSYVPIYLFELNSANILLVGDKINQIRKGSVYDWFLYMRDAVRSALIAKRKGLVFRCRQHKAVLSNILGVQSHAEDESLRRGLLADLSLLEAWNVMPNDYNMGWYSETSAVYNKWKKSLPNDAQNMLSEMEKQKIIQ